MKYSERCGPDKKLHEIVVAGSHDAGITGGAANVKTQEEGLKGQADAGVRVFDIRIAVDAKHGGDLKTYHGAKISPERKSIRGAYGERLTNILLNAQDFVTRGEGVDEFLILKFDKCKDWKGIADGYAHVIGERNKVAGHVNVNTMSLAQLAGKVVACFSDTGWKEARVAGADMKGIHRFTNLSGGGEYDRSKLDGIAYYGKGGTSIWKPFGKISQNKANQKDLMKTAAHGKKNWLGQTKARAVHPEVLGMMYWTTTGIFESIEKRNDRMWKDKRMPALQALWKQGLGDALMESIPNFVDPTAHSSGPVLKRFMPNIVMIDFATPDRCETIADLNTLAATALTEAAQADAG